MSAIDSALEVDRLEGMAPMQAGGGSYRVHVKEVTTSTNDDVRALAAEGAPEGTVVFAEEQVAGRGRRGNLWIAPPRRCLLFSLLLRPKHEPALWPRVTHLAALAVCRAIEPLLAPVAPLVKWPNDVLVRGRKLSGILLESAASSSGGFLILGLGLNVNLGEADFPAELQGAASSLKQETGRTINRTDVALKFLEHFATLYPTALECFDQALAEVHQRSFLIGKHVTLNQSGCQLSGSVTGFGPGGELRLKAEGTERLLSSGELVRVAAMTGLQ